MTRTEHRLGPNFKDNHPNTGQHKSEVRHEYPWQKEVKKTWKREAALPENQAQKK